MCQSIAPVHWAEPRNIATFTAYSNHTIVLFRRTRFWSFHGIRGRAWRGCKFGARFLWALSLFFNSNAMFWLLHVIAYQLGDNCIQNVHCGRNIVGYMVGNLNFRPYIVPYIWWYTSQNKHFEYSYPLNDHTLDGANQNMKRMHILKTSMREDTCMSTLLLHQTPSQHVYGRPNNVVSTSHWRHDVASTLIRRYFEVDLTFSHSAGGTVRGAEKLRRFQFHVKWNSTRHNWL